MNSQVSHLGKTCAMLQQENQQLTREGELRWYQAVEEERRKWEARESQLLTEIVELKQLLKVGETSQGLRGGVSVTSDVFPVNHSNSIVPPTTTSSSSIVSAPVVFSSSQLPASVGTSDILHECNSQVSLLTSNSATSYVSTSLPLYLLQEVPLSSHHLRLYRSMETSCHLSLDSQGRRTHPN